MVNPGAGDGVLTAEELASLQADWLAVADLTADISRPASTRDAFGFLTGTAASVATGVACLIGKPSAALLAEYAGRLGEQATWLVEMPATADVREGDLLTISGQQMLVHAVLAPMSYSVTTQALCGAIEPA